MELSDLGALSMDVMGREVDIMALLAIDDTDLSREYTQQAALFAWLGTEAAAAERHLADAQLAKDVMYSQLDAAYRAARDANGIKYTEAMIKADIITDDDYQHAMEMLSNAEYRAGVMKAIMAAMKQRADMLVSLGANMRQEYDMTGLSLKQQKYDGDVAGLKSILSKKRK